MLKRITKGTREMSQEPCKKCGEYHNNCYELAELTDEEILQANLEFGKENGEDYSMLTIEDIEPLIGLVKFILKKASEKWQQMN